MFHMAGRNGGYNTREHSGVRGLRRAAALGCVRGAAVFFLVLAGCAPPHADPQLVGGIADLREGRFAEAAQQLEAAAARMPDNAAVLANLGIAYWKTGRPADAVEALRAAAELDPVDERLLEFLAEIHMEREEWDAARHALERARLAAGDTASVLTRMGVLEARMGRSAAARRCFERALEINPGYPPAWFNLGLALWSEEAREEAAERFRAYLDLAAEPDSRRNAAQHYLALSLAPRPPAPLVPEAPAAEPEPARPSLSTLLTEVTAAIERRDAQRALALLRRAAQEHPEDPSVHWMVALLFDRHLEQPERAETAYRAFLRRFPEDGRANRAKARLAEISRPAEADLPSIAVTPAVNERPAAPVAAPAPDPEPASPARQTLARRAGETVSETAPVALRRAVEAFTSGLECQGRGDHAGAVHHYRTALALNPDHIHALYNLGLVYREQSNGIAARDAFRSVLERDPGMYRAEYMLAVVYREMNDIPAALRHLERALRLKPDYARAHLLLGLVHEAQGNPAAAREHMIRYLRLEPHGPLSDDIRTRVRQLP